jgi:hypothetical protein
LALAIIASPWLFLATEPVSFMRWVYIGAWFHLALFGVSVILVLRGNKRRPAEPSGSNKPLDRSGPW